MMERNSSSDRVDDEVCSKSSSCRSEEVGSDAGDDGGGEERSDYSSSYDSSGSISSASNSYIDDSDGSDSEDDSIGSSDSSSSGGSSHSFSDDDLDSKASNDGNSSEQSGRTALNRDQQSKSSSNQIMAPLSDASENYSTKRTFHRGVLPIMTQGLALPPRLQGNGDQNCDPNRSTLIHRRGRSMNDQDKETRNMRHPNDPQSRPSDYHDGKDKSTQSRQRHRARSSRQHHHKRSRKSKSGNNFSIRFICCQSKKRSTQILVLSLAIWIIAQCYYFYYWSLKDFFMQDRPYNEFFWGNDNNPQWGRGMSGRERNKLIHHLHGNLTPEEMDALREERAREALDALGTGAGDFDPYAFRRDPGGKPGKLNNQKNRGRKKSRDSEGSSRVERLREGCSALEWHSYHFANCNEIHSIDMLSVVERRPSWRRESRKGFVEFQPNTQSVVGRRHRRRKEDEEESTQSQQHNLSWGFVGAGLWRDVFSCDPHEEALVAAASSNGASPPVPPAVLKMMKSEHPYDQRNFQRHRRDALVMERLSSSHHLVPIYGYCANTVLTQAISHTLDDVIYARENEKVKKWSPNGGYQTKPPLESWMGKDDDGELLATRETELGRIKLALGVFRGLMDLHEGDGSEKEWLPIVHADLQSKQYLVDAQTGQIYLNDFNRCRFLAKKDRPANSTSGINIKTGNSSNLESCPLYIPTAPGAARSPEEYDLAPLSEKLDVYSAGNVLYGIITGERPWGGERGRHIKSAVQKGERPEVSDAIRNMNGTVDAELTRLLDRVYEGNPIKRASAKEVVEELEKLLDRELREKRE